MAYLPWHRDQQDIERRRRNAGSDSYKLFWIVVWFILVVVFV